MGGRVVERQDPEVHEVTQELRQAARGGLVSVAGAAVSAGMGFVLTLVLARALGQTGSGVVLQAVAVFSIALGVSRAGMDTASIWILPRLAQTSGEHIRGAVVGLLIPTIVVASVLTVILVPFIPQLGLGGDAHSADVVAAARLVMWFLPFGALMMVALAASRGLGNVVPYTVIGAIGVPAARPVAVLLVVALGGTAVWAALAWAIPLPLAALAIVLTLWKRIRAHERRAGVEGRWLPDRDVFSKMWRFALPRWYSAGVEQSIVWFDVILVGAIAGTGAAGVYGTASRFVTAGLIISTAMRMVISPRFSALLGENRISAVQELYSTTVVWIVLLGAPIYGIFMFFAPTALGWLGKGFEQGSTALVILCAGSIASLLAGNVDSVLMMSGRSAWMAANKSVVLAVNVAGNFLLVPAWGITGAATAWALSLVLEATLVSVQSRLFLGVNFDAKRVLYALFATAASVAPVSLLAIHFMGNNTLSCLAAGAGTMAVLALWCRLDRRRFRLSDLDLLPGRRRKPAATLPTAPESAH